MPSKTPYEETLLLMNKSEKSSIKMSLDEACLIKSITFLSNYQVQIYSMQLKYRSKCHKHADVRANVAGNEFAAPRNLFRADENRSLNSDSSCHENVMTDSRQLVIKTIVILDGREAMV